ncbi:hypothetical protein CERZMDRAFT_91793 [Cercospora zeae-maydis SCOH1-5]|uniref:Uncharacterized protein n=1 Tax=Cercospora zeae-maydis SCOH1-5 TaxID=717836 RepID=A0A6A6F4S8_9PEZI|nr:hypothetical protein CERZMDRAFT_91793 [Cercospora zeae-maydis SCOH1-5]
MQACSARKPLSSQIRPCLPKPGYETPRALGSSMGKKDYQADEHVRTIPVRWNFILNTDKSQVS